MHLCYTVYTLTSRLLTINQKKEVPVARDNYSYKKYQRELAKKKKKEEKIQRKLDKKNRPAGQGAEQISADAIPGTLDQATNGQDNKIQ